MPDYQRKYIADAYLHRKARGRELRRKHEEKRAQLLREIAEYGPVDPELKRKCTPMK